jgi:hypothetical protein
MIVLDSEKAARQFKAMVQSDPGGRGGVGIVPETLTVTRVIAHAASRPH